MSNNLSNIGNGFSEEEKRLRSKMIKMGIRQKDIAESTGIIIQDVSQVIRGRSRSPRYVAEVYKYLGLEFPEKSDDEVENNLRK